MLICSLVDLGLEIGLGLVERNLAKRNFFLYKLVSEPCLYFKIQEMASKINLEKFTSQNDFSMWKIKMKALLITQGIGDAIDPATKQKEKSLE